MYIYRNLYGKYPFRWKATRCVPEFNSMRTDDSAAILQELDGIDDAHCLEIRAGINLQVRIVESGHIWETVGEQDGLARIPVYSRAQVVGLLNLINTCGKRQSYRHGIVIKTKLRPGMR